MISIDKYEAAPCIFIYRNVLNSQNFTDLIEEEADKPWPHMMWYRSQVDVHDGSDGYVSEYRTSLEMSMQPLLTKEINNDLKDLQKIMVEDIFKPLDECIWDYRNYFGLELRRETGFALLKYSGGSEYHIHHDHGYGNERVLSMIACLGEDSFIGGELEFNNFNLTVKLNKDDVILFPSNFPYTHIAHPVESGIKYSLVTWFI